MKLAAAIAVTPLIENPWALAAFTIVMATHFWDTRRLRRP